MCFALFFITSLTRSNPPGMRYGICGGRTAPCLRASLRLKYCSHSMRKANAIGKVDMAKKNDIQAGSASTRTSGVGMSNMTRGPKKIAKIADIGTSSVGMQERMNEGPGGSSNSAIVVADSNVDERVLCATKGRFSTDATQRAVSLLQISSTSAWSVMVMCERES